ncbi:MAG: depolymerase [Gammaproteobacteria bacterium]|nr:depolymerase [Gammaproteobacteria bacterium]
MAVQYQVAFSASVRGAGIVAGGPYYCAAGNALNAPLCMGQVPGVPPAAPLMVAAAAGFAAAGQIDALEHLRAQRVYVFSGTRDTVVRPAAVAALVAFYRALGIDGEALQYVDNVPAGHAMITADYGNACDANAAPYISHCSVAGAGYDQAGAILRQLFGALNAPAAVPAGALREFDQTEFGSGAARMADSGRVYVPHTCADGAPCAVLIAFHGCAQSELRIGDGFYAHAGFNRWADTNALIVLYPQVDATLLNPQGCWDWFGYTGPGYATRYGPQLAAVHAMAERLVGGGWQAARP